MWTYENIEGLLENVTVIRKSKDGVHTLSQLLAHENYILHQIDDIGFTDENGKYFPPTYSQQVTTSTKNEAITINLYEAISIKDMIIEKPEEELSEIEQKAQAYDILTGGAE